MQRIDHLIISLCVFLHPNGKIFHAEPLHGKEVVEAGPNEFPFIVSIGIEKLQDQNKYGEAHVCTGSLITRKHVLTSAHCIDGLPKETRLNDLVVTVGSHDLRYGQRYGVAQATTYEEYATENKCIKKQVKEDGEYHDIAIFLLNKCVSGEITLAKVSKLSRSELRDMTAVTAGWGVTDTNNNPVLLSKATLDVLSKNKCDKLAQKIMHKRKFEVWERNVCSKASPHILLGCGDSGGPLLINNNEIIGINDSVCPAGLLVSSSKKINQHLVVSYYKNFIKVLTIGKSGKCTVL